MKIDWNDGTWRVLDVHTDAVLGVYHRVVLVGVSGELICNASGKHGWLVVFGELTVDGNTAFIRVKKNGKD